MLIKENTKGPLESGPFVLLATDLPQSGVQLLSERIKVNLCQKGEGRTAFIESVKGASAIISDLTVRIDSEVLDSAGPQLKVVANYAVGFDNIDLDACRARGIVVTNTPDVLTNATAELALALALAASRHLVQSDSLVRSGKWHGWAPDQFLGLELSDSTIGTVGLGKIGTRFAELARGFTSNLIYTNRSEKPGEEDRLGLKKRTLDELLSEADLVSLHVPLCEETYRIIDAEALAKMKPGAVLVNTGRGELVDTDALIDALQSGGLRAAGLDVYEDEPNVPDRLKKLKNVVLASHIASATEKARNEMAQLVARNVVAVIKGEEALTPVR